MPRYFFNTRIRGELIPDSEGADLRDPDHAWTLARSMIRKLLQDGDGPPDLLTASLEVTDEKGDVVLEFPFAEAITLPPGDPETRH
jgi:hypothetical protein